ncbi:MAG: hypothetical protein MUF72_07875 [Elainella sp. Prado103]|jgi:hypothetical protein|nr:hypothetical protein [Elainella sp. Prado103]
MVRNQAREGEQQPASLETWLSNPNHSFNFDSWATAVRQQMIAALKKREQNRIKW